MKEPLFRVIIAVMTFLLIIAGCSQQDPSAPEESSAVPQNGFSSRLSKTSGGDELPMTSDKIDAINVMLIAGIYQAQMQKCGGDKTADSEK